MGNSVLSDSASSHRTGPFFGWYLASAGGLMSLCYGFFLAYGFGAFLPHILEDTGWTRAQAGGVYGILGAEISVLAPLFGYIITRFGARKPLLIGSILAAAGLLWASKMDSLAIFYLSFGLAGLGFSTFQFGPTAVIANWFDKKRTLAMGIIFAGPAMSGLLLPLLHWGLTHYGWREMMAFTGAVTFLLCAPLSLLFRFTPEPYGYQVDGEPPVVGESEQQDTDEAAAPKVSFKTLIYSREYWLLAGLYLVAVVGFSGTLPHMLVYFKDVGIDGSLGALSFSFFAVVSVISRIGGGYLADRYGKRKVIQAGLIGLSIGLIACGFISQAWHLIFFVLLVGPGVALLTPTLPALTAEVFGPRSFALAFAYVMVPGVLLSIMAPATVGWIADTYGSYRLAFLICGGMVFVGLPLAWLVPEKRSPMIN